MGLAVAVGNGVLIGAGSGLGNGGTGGGVVGVGDMGGEGWVSAVFTLGGKMSGLALLGLSVVSAIGFAAFVRTKARAQAPLVRLDLLRDRTLGTGLASLMLVSAIVMATLVVGPFYLGGVLVLDPAGTGMVMSIGPAVAAVTGVPAGRLVDRTGPFPVIVGGLLAVMFGALLLTVLPGPFGTGGYAASLVVLTFGYAMFQAANMTAIMQTTANDRRGVTSALLGLARNMGLIWGASAMAAVYAMGPRIAEATGFGAGDSTGLIATFALSAGLAGVALAATFWVHRRA